MATSKTLTPTNVTIQIPEFTDQPDQRVNSNCIDKEADAINTLNSKLDIPESSVDYYTIYPNGRIANPQSAVITIPIYNPHEKTVSISEAYVYSANGTATNIKSSVTVSISKKTHVTILIAFNSTYAGCQARFVLAYS